ncbi:hypothetical protein AUQ41_01635 [Thalassospira sp. MCCC 1A02898]|nr:hypothetical protein AUQ41_01635 [Thalassospira sp. MCCC 1A02898]
MQVRWLWKWQSRFEKIEKPSIILSVFPFRKVIWLEAISQLIIGLDGPDGFLGAGTDKGKPKLIAQKAQHIEELTLLGKFALRDVMKFINNDEARTDALKNVQYLAFEICCCIAGSVNSSNFIEDLFVESSKFRPWWHRDKNNRDLVSFFLWN